MESRGRRTCRVGGGHVEVEERHAISEKQKKLKYMVKEYV